MFIFGVGRMFRTSGQRVLSQQLVTDRGDYKDPVFSVVLNQRREEIFLKGVRIAI